MRKNLKYRCWDILANRVHFVNVHKNIIIASSLTTYTMSPLHHQFHSKLMKQTKYRKKLGIYNLDFFFFYKMFSVSDIQNELILHEAVIKNDVDAVKAIMKEPVDVNFRNNVSIGTQYFGNSCVQTFFFPSRSNELLLSWNENLFLNLVLLGER